MITDWLREHATSLKTAGIHTVRGLGYLIIGIVIGAIAALQIPRNLDPHAKPLPKLLREYFDELLAGFTNVFMAQIYIATINTALTALYLLIILPLIGKPLPLAGTMVTVTFFAGLIPVVGNLISNTFIVIMSLSDSVGVAFFSLVWLVAIHKLEYFLNAEIIGQKIHAKAWELLIVMIMMESAFGIAGLISAPIMYAQIKRLLKRNGWV